MFNKNVYCIKKKLTIIIAVFLMLPFKMLYIYVMEKKCIFFIKCAIFLNKIVLFTTPVINLPFEEIPPIKTATLINSVRNLSKHRKNYQGP